MVDSIMNEKPSRILVIDDDNIILSTVGEMLELRGFEVKKLSSAREALKHIASYPCDVIISDINMPDMTGLDLVKRIRSFNTEVAIILMTGFVESYSIQDAILSGADEYIQKPFDEGQLYRIVQQAFWRRLALRVTR